MIKSKAFVLLFCIVFASVQSIYGHEGHSHDHDDYDYDHDHDEEDDTGIIESSQ
jgi:hypothetical protein